MFSDKIWITRKTRIFTEKRLQEMSNITQALIVVYSLALVSQSLWNLEINNPNINVMLVFASIFVLVLSIYLISQKYAERSIAMRNCYVKLDELLTKAKRAENNNDEKTLEGLESEYTSLLLNIENHTEYDYLCLRFSLRKNLDTTLPTFTRADFARYVFEKTWRMVIIIFVFAISLPFIVFNWIKVF
jgi:hypothetical protein